MAGVTVMTQEDFVWRFDREFAPTIEVQQLADCPRLSGGAVVVPAPATLRIINGCQSKAEAPAVKSRVFQLTTDKARAAPDVLTETFLVIGLSAHVLFDSGATRSFVSLALNKKFRDVPGTLESPLEVEIANDRTLSVARVFRKSIQNMFDERFPIDLVLIPLKGMKMIIGINWLGPNGAVIDCERQLVRVRTPSGGELVISGERASHGPTLYSPARAKRLLQQGCSGFLAYVSDSRVETTIELSRVPIVHDFPDVFPEELPGVPLEREVEFRIDLMSGVASIVKAS
ncbi:uncharacterized protein LOC111915809 [Lactuca sativa]|uniref:uncharacterized protein LOC111915809 n=1 Tax=Lactuca sativa TaxID=4236 RepID=UPI000CD8CCC2|nr:uncharacterized protein LOC111915809 [Lactuca sativa]